MSPPNPPASRPRVRGIAVLHSQACREGEASRCPADTIIDIPDSVSPSLQSSLQSLDTNSDGLVSYTPSQEDQFVQRSEVNPVNGTSDTMMRAIWGYWGTSPYNNRELDRAARTSRGTEWNTWVQSVRSRFFNRIDTDAPISAWRERLQGAADLCTPGFLLALAQSARTRGRELQASNPDPTEAREFFDLAEEALTRSLRLSSRMPRYYDFIGELGPTQAAALTREFNTLNPFLDSWDQAEFAVDRQRPYILATRGSPLTQEVSNLPFGFGEVTTVVAVPARFLEGAANDGERSKRIQDYFNEIAHPRIVVGNDASRLRALHVTPDSPTPYDDVIGLTTSFHTHHNNLNRNLFHVPNDGMLYFNVSFGVERSDQLTNALGSNRARAFDIVVNRENGLVNGLIRPQRTLAASFVVQNTLVGANHTVVASDIHIAHRDFEMMAEVSRYLPEEQQPQREIIERIYFSATERVLAAVQEWNHLYRTHQIDRVVLTGDLADFVNRASTLSLQPYRQTNVRDLMWVLSQLEAPLYVASGNHDAHGHPYPTSVECRTLRREESLCPLYEEGYDDHHFEGLLLFNGVKALIPGAYGNVEDASAFLRIVSQIYRDNPFHTTREDDFMTPHLQLLGANENYGFTVGNDRFYIVKSGPEDFSWYNFLYTQVPFPQAINIVRSLYQYVTGREVLGRGPTQNEFISLVYEAAMARERGQHLIPFLHYPVYTHTNGPDQTPMNADGLSGNVTKAFRLLTWHYRLSDGSFVIPQLIAGHIHHYTETDFAFMLTADEETQLHRDVDLIFRGIDPTLSQERILEILHNRRITRELSIRQGNTPPPYDEIMDLEDRRAIYDRLSALWDRMGLSAKIRIRSVNSVGSEGTPTNFAQTTHNTPIQATTPAPGISEQLPGALFSTLPPLGPESLDGNGYMVLTTGANQPAHFEMRYIRVGFDNQIHSDTGDHLSNFLNEEWTSLNAWDPHHSFRGRRTPTTISSTHIRNGSLFLEPRQTSWLPLICQYPLGQTCLDINLNASARLTSPHGAFSVGLNLIIPFADRPNPLFGLNYFFIGGGIDTSSTFQVMAGANLGIFNLAALARTRTDLEQENAWVGVRAATEHGLPFFFLPNIGLDMGSWVINRPETPAGFQMDLSFIWRFTAMSSTPPRVVDR